MESLLPGAQHREDRALRLARRPNSRAIRAREAAPARIDAALAFKVQSGRYERKKMRRANLDRTSDAQQAAPTSLSGLKHSLVRPRSRTLVPVQQQTCTITVQEQSMSRSRRKTPITGVTLVESEKKDKLASHRIYRRTLKQLITPDLETPLPTEQQLTNPWSMAKDGKLGYNTKLPKKLLRK